MFNPHVWKEITGASASPKQRKTKMSSRPRILIVEDEWLIRMGLAQALQDAGWTVVEASSGEGAVEHLQDEAPIEAIITDVRLAGLLSGWRVAAAFRAAEPHIPVIYVSGNPPDRSQMVKGGRFFSKPYRTTELVETCRALHLTGAP